MKPNPCRLNLLPIEKGPAVYKIEETTYGFTLVFGGAMYREELSQWLKEREQTLASAASKRFPCCRNERYI